MKFASAYDSGSMWSVIKDQPTRKVVSLLETDGWLLKRNATNTSGLEFIHLIRGNKRLSIFGRDGKVGMIQTGQA